METDCWNCGYPLGELEPGERVTCPHCGHDVTLEEDDTAELYAEQEEEDRERWIPGYKEAKEAIAREEAERFRRWDRHGPYPLESMNLHELHRRVREWQQQRGVPPWERSA